MEILDHSSQEEMKLQLNSFISSETVFIKNTEQLLRHSCCAFASFFSVNLNLDSLLAKLSPSSTSPASHYSLTLLGRGEERAGGWGMEGV